ncbi:MAG: alkaline phosphatase family protein [Microgenomates group bacterium]
MNKKLGIVLLVCALTFSLYIASQKKQNSGLKLYWFIPDGLRAEPNVMNIYKWARDGKLPNIKKLMDSGTYGYSRPTFPSHTPINFATLLTGSYPKTHGIDDGPMRTIGASLDKIAIPGFRSTSRKVPAIWSTLEEAHMKVDVLSVPGSTPPEIEKGVVLRGRWGGWGADFFALNFETKGDLSQRIKQGLASRLFYAGAQLTQYNDAQIAHGWAKPPISYSPAYDVTLTGWNGTVYGYIYDSTNDNVVNYDRMAFSSNKKMVFANLKPGEWSEWQPITLTWTVGDKKIPVDTQVRATVIKLGQDGFYRVRLYYNNLNKYIAQPPESADIMTKEVGPMVDFVDNFPFQLGYYPEDKKTFLQEANMSFDWHTKAVSALVKQFSPDAVIHDIYTPNQMLTAPWWMGYVDPQSETYKKASETQKKQAYDEIFEMYKRIDTMIGEVLKVADSNTYVVFSSDHGNIPLNTYVNLNNLFAKKGWLKFTIDSQTGEPIVDWKNTQVIYLKMAHVYINPNGLEGIYTRASGPAYEALRSEVEQTLKNLKDVNGQKPLVEVTQWEQARDFLQMDPDRAGDLVIANAPGYGWSENMSEDLTLFEKAKEGGYKQAVDPNIPGMWTPFMISGPGIKQNNFLGDKPINHIDQYPTIMKALEIKSPSFVEGKALPIFMNKIERGIDLLLRKLY